MPNYLALDIETTGPHLDTDCLIAVGACFGTISEDGKTAEILWSERFMNKRFFDKSPQTDWAHTWHFFGYDKRTYDEFWSKNLFILDELQKDVANHTVDMSKAMNLLLARAETAGKFLVLTDTTTYDTVWLQKLLLCDGYNGLSHTRDSTSAWRSAIEVDSYRFGAMGALPGDWNALYAKMREVPFALAEETPAHFPDIDARNIFSQLANTVLWMKSQPAVTN